MLYVLWRDQHQLAHQLDLLVENTNLLNMTDLLVDILNVSLLLLHSRSVSLHMADMVHL
jgi:hypothetical protein